MLNCSLFSESGLCYKMSLSSPGLVHSLGCQVVMLPCNPNFYIGDVAFVYIQIVPLSSSSYDLILNTLLGSTQMLLPTLQQHPGTQLCFNVHATSKPVGFSFLYDGSNIIINVSCFPVCSFVPKDQCWETLWHLWWPFFVCFIKIKVSLGSAIMFN